MLKQGVCSTSLTYVVHETQAECGINIYSIELRKSQAARCLVVELTTTPRVIKRKMRRGVPVGVWSCMLTTLIH